MVIDQMGWPNEFSACVPYWEIGVGQVMGSNQWLKNVWTSQHTQNNQWIYYLIPLDTYFTKAIRYGGNYQLGQSHELISLALILSTMCNLVIFQEV